jgi:hypothetical protein
MNKEQQELLDEAYLNYYYSCIRETKKQEREMIAKGGWLTLCLTPFFEKKEEFINKIKTNPDFAKQWGVTIYTVVEDGNIKIGVNYNNKTIESYERSIDKK